MVGFCLQNSSRTTCSSIEQVRHLGSCFPCKSFQKSLTRCHPQPVSKTIPLAMVDPAFAKHQLDVLTREWFMRPDGALPAYEWDFGDVNPPVHAWATFRVFKLERKTYGRADLPFLEKVFQKLLINFTWWTNRMDPS